MTQSTEAPPIASAYVYGVVRADSIPSLEVEGVADAPVRTVVHGDLAALVSALPDGEFRIRRRDLLGHLGVLEKAFAGSTIVPCAFGMVLSSDQAVVDEFLEPRGDELREVLQRLDGFGQLNVRAAYDEEVVLQEIVAGDATIAHLREQTRGLDEVAGHDLRIRLGEHVSAALASVRERDAEALLDRLAPNAADVVVEDAGGDVLKASFLVAREGSIAFDRELEDASREGAPRLRIEVVGPLPPTAFASAERGAWGS